MPWPSGPFIRVCDNDVVTRFVNTCVCQSGPVKPYLFCLTPTRRARQCASAPPASVPMAVFSGTKVSGYATLSVP